MEAGLRPSKWPGLGRGSVPPHLTRHTSGMGCKVLATCSLGVIDGTTTRCRPFAPTRGRWLAPLVSLGCGDSGWVSKQCFWLAPLQHAGAERTRPSTLRPEPRRPRHPRRPRRPRHPRRPPRPRRPRSRLRPPRRRSLRLSQTLTKVGFSGGSPVTVSDGYSGNLAAVPAGRTPSTDGHGWLVFSGTTKHFWGGTPTKRHGTYR